jgi:hypothetical protein
MLALLPGCATPAARPAPTPQWLAGTWLEQDPGERSLLACASGLPVAYNSDGTFGTWEWNGVWRLEGDRLIETATVDNEMIEPEEVPLGKPFVSRIVRVGDNEMRRIRADGKRAAFLRCPSQ